jgi:hypothetical protein
MNEAETCEAGAPENVRMDFGVPEIRLAAETDCIL